MACGRPYTLQNGTSPINLAVDDRPDACPSQDGQSVRPHSLVRGVPVHAKSDWNPDPAADAHLASVTESPMARRARYRPDPHCNANEASTTSLSSERSPRALRAWVQQQCTSLSGYHCSRLLLNLMSTV